jgi:hypothetical protein
MGMSGPRHAQAAIYFLGKDPQYPLDRRLGGPQSYSRGKSFASAGERNPVTLSFSL